MPGETMSHPPGSLSARSIFIVGNARSGTSAFCDCLNLSPEIHLFQEANLFVNSAREDFASFFNAQHEAYGNPRAKGTYVAPDAPRATALSVLERLARRYRYVGEKVAFGPLSTLGGRPYQDVFFDFQAECFFDACYLAVMRRPAETVWSMSKMWPSYGIDCLIECWLRTFALSIEVYRFFPRAHVFFWERFDAATARQAGRLLGVGIDVPDGMITRSRINSALSDAELPQRLRPYRGTLRTCDDIYGRLEGVFGEDDFRVAGPQGTSWLLDDLVGRSRECLERLGRRAAATVPPDSELALDSGERMVPGEADPVVAGEHRSRYAFASRWVKGKRVLDVGCGTGYGSDLLAGAGAASVLGIDPSPDAVAYARSNYGRTGLAFEVAAWPGENVPEKSFDVVVMLEVIEHIDDADACLLSVRRALADGGVLVLSTPNQAEHPGELFNPFHVREYERLELLALLKGHFPFVRLYHFGFGISSVVAVDPGQAAQLPVDGSLLDPSADELPFFIAACGPDEKTVGCAPGVLFPIVFDRHLASERPAAARRATAAEQARQLIVWAFAEPERFRVRLARSGDDVRGALRRWLEKLVGRGESAVACRLLEILLDLEPERPEWHYLYACSVHWRVPAHATGPEDALEHFSRALAGGFDEYWIRLNRGSLLESLARLEEAETDLERATELQPAAAAAREAWRRIRISRARRLIEAKEHAAALDLLRDDRLGDLAERDYLVGFCLHRTPGTGDSALGYYGRALAGGFDEFWVRLNRGGLLRALGRFADAEVDLARALELAPANEGAQQEYATLQALKAEL